MNKTSLLPNFANKTYKLLIVVYNRENKILLLENKDNSGFVVLYLIIRIITCGEISELTKAFQKTEI